MVSKNKNNEPKAPRRMGITKNPDGTLTMSICRAMPGNEGKGRCKHNFAHGTRAQMQTLITDYMIKRDSGMLEGVNYTRDMNSVKLSLREYLISTGRSPKKLGEDDSIRKDWFDGDKEAYVAALREAAEEGPLKNLKSSDAVISDVKDLNAKGIGVTVTTDRMLGLREDDDTEPWNALNGVDSNDFEGEAPVVIMTGSAAAEPDAAEFVRDEGHVKIDDVKGERKAEMKDLGYVSAR